MQADNLNRRLAALENTQEELILFSFQWDDGPLIKRMVPKSRVRWLNEAQS